MRNQLQRGGARATLRCLAAVLGLVVLAPGLLSATSKEKQRSRMGLRLFKTLLAADLALEERAEGDEVPVFFVFARDRAVAVELAELFGTEAEGSDEGPSIHGLALRIEVADVRSVGSRGAAAIFLTEPLSDALLERLVGYGIDQRILVYSPFEGDVEKGVAAGLYVGAQVRPYVNLATLKAAGIRLKSFFLRAARTYPSTEGSP